MPRKRKIRSGRKIRPSTLEAFADMARAFEASPSAADHREHRLVAIGLRADGQLVIARNATATDTMPSAHAEARLARKLDVGSTVIVLRIRPTGDLGLAKPCLSCQNRMRSRGVRVVWYSTDAGRFRKIELA